MPRDINQLSADLRKIASVAEVKSIAKLTQAAEIVRGKAIRSIQTQSFGRDVIRYTSAGSPYNHVAAPEGSAPNTDRGDLVRNILVKPRGSGTVVVGSFEGAPHGKWLELGNQHGQKWPWLMPAFDSSRDDIRKILKPLGREIIKASK